MLSRRLAAFVLISTIMLVSLVPLQASTYTYTAHIGLLAVTDHSGEVIPADVTVSRGNNGLVLQPKQYIHPSVLYSTHVGYVLASLLNHLSPSNVYARVFIHTNTEVQGPSASGFLASIIYLGIRGIYPRNDTTMTGMISLTGFILPVAGIKYKVEAAAKAGYHRVILPYGEGTLNKTIGKNPIIVLHACSIEQAVANLASAPLELTLYNVSYVNSSIRAIIHNYINVNIFTNYTKMFLRSLELLLREYNGEDKNVYIKLADMAQQALSNGDSYSAASIAFYSLVSIAERIASTRGFSYVEERMGTNLSKEIKLATRELQAASKTALNDSKCDAWRIEALAAASARLYLAKHAANSPSGDKVLALLRAISARSWIELANNVRGPQVPCTLLKETIRNYVDYASLSYQYINNVLPFLAKRLLMPDNRSVTAWLKDAHDALEKGNHLLALGLAENTLSSFEDVLVDYAELPLSCVAKHVYFLLKESSIEYPLPALLYIDYALTYAIKVGEIIKRQNFASILGSDAAAWALFGLFSWMTNQTLTASTTSTGSSELTYIEPSSMTPLVIEALVLGIIVYAVAGLARRASSQEL